MVGLDSCFCAATSPENLLKVSEPFEPWPIRLYLPGREKSILKPVIDGWLFKI